MEALTSAAIAFAEGTCVHPIRTEADYDRALSEIAGYFEREPDPGSTEADRFDVLAALIKAYEDEHWPIEAAHPPPRSVM